ncbi:MAG: AAA family ATPase [Candidatus Omnitrophica bacterium]|nr:AAA family ATPase [Candidatus Omnitrophota bacterium]
MGYIIAVAGKGGTGKTTIAALLVRIIKEKRRGEILAVDADPNSNLAENLGLKPRQTIGQILDEVSAHPEDIPPGVSKDRFIEYKIHHNVIEEADGFDILTMGRPEGPGCYCYVNNVLRGIMTKLIKNYRYIIIDNEAGLEHLSRRTTRTADVFLVISDATSVGLRSARRIIELVQELSIDIKKKVLIINRCDSQRQVDIDKMLQRENIQTGLEFIGCIPQDQGILDISLNGGSLLDLADDAVSINTLRKIGDRICPSI